MLTSNDSNTVANAICHAASMIQEPLQQVAYEYVRPAVMFKPKLYLDGNQFCALYGDDLQSGVAGFGPSPTDAMWDFDKQWNTKIKEQQ